MSALLSADEAAEQLQMSTKTLRRHVKDGTIGYIVTGRGFQRQRIAFDPVDIEAFKSERRRRSPPCQSTAPRVTPSTTSTSKSVVIGFMERRRQAIAERQSKSRG
jgi:excisionase family DNA binding protein